MKWQLLIAWRNLWRNPRRTLVILVSVITGIWMMLFLGAIMWGMVTGMLDSTLSNLTGHIQIHHPKFMNDPAVENRLEDTAELEKVLGRLLPEGSLVASRVRLPVFVSNARHSGGVVLVGTDLDTARQVTFLESAGIEGHFPGADSGNGILVGRELLDDFETTIGNKLIITARDANGETASRAFRIVGSFDTFLEASETSFAFVTREVAREFLSLGPAVTEVAITLPDIRQTEAVLEALNAALDEQVHHLTPWQDLSPVVTAYLKIWDYFSYIWAVVVFAAMGFGLVNTLLMAVYDRIREFGLVRALGMSGRRIATGIILEAFFLLLVGLLAGNLLAFAAVGWLGQVGIDLAGFSETTEILGLSRMIYPAIQMRDFLVFNGMVAGLGLLVSLYPAWKAARFTPVEAMNHFK